jgi:hypothetical protein
MGCAAVVVATPAVHRKLSAIVPRHCARDLD